MGPESMLSQNYNISLHIADKNWQYIFRVPWAVSSTACALFFQSGSKCCQTSLAILFFQMGGATKIYPTFPYRISV